MTLRLTIASVLDAISSAYQDAGGSKLSNERAIAHGVAALLRRGLKLWERDGNAARTEEIVTAAMTLAQLTGSVARRDNPNLSMR